MQATNEDIEIVTGGSFFKAGPILLEPLCARVLSEIPGAQFVHFDGQPVIGAVLLAMRSDNLPPERMVAARERLLQAQA